MWQAQYFCDVFRRCEAVFDSFCGRRSTLAQHFLSFAKETFFVVEQCWWFAVSCVACLACVAWLGSSAAMDLASWLDWSLLGLVCCWRCWCQSTHCPGCLACLVLAASQCLVEAGCGPWLLWWHGLFSQHWLGSHSEVRRFLPRSPDDLHWRLQFACGTRWPSCWCYENLTATDWVRTKELFFHFVFHFFSCFISFSDHVKFSFSFFFHSPIMRKCHSHLFIVFPSCAVNSIMCILVPSRLVDTQRKTSKSKTQKLRPQPQFLWGRNSRLLQVRIRLTLIVN